MSKQASQDARLNEASDETPEHSNQGDGPRGISAIEWIIAAVGLVIVVGVIGFLVIEAMRDRGTPPSLSFEVDSLTAVSGGYVVELSVQNDGDMTAADVTVTGQLLDGDTVVEERELTLDFVPPRSTRRGGLFFSENPDDWTLVFAPDGYQEP